MDNLPEPSCDPVDAPGGGFRKWVINHDDSWIFIMLYSGLALALSVFVSLFWLAAVVAIHAAMEWYRQRARSPERVFPRVLWEMKLDLALILLALAVSLYMDILIGLAGLGQVARAGARIGSRVAGWQRALRGALLSVDDAAQVGKALLKGGKRAKGKPGEDIPLEGGWGGRWSVGVWISLGLGAVCLLLIVAAPLVSSRSAGEVAEDILRQFHPWPAGR